MKHLNFSNCHILVVGDIMLDRYFWGQVNRISPEAPVPVVKVYKTKDTLGGAANSVNNIAGLGARSTLIGTVGKDQNRYILEEILDQLGVNCHFIETQASTTTKIRVIGEKQQITRIDFEQIKNITSQQVKQISQYIEAQLDRVDVIVISDYGKGICSFEMCRAIMQLAVKKNKIVIVDPKGNNWDKYHRATIITPNVMELGHVLGREIKNEDHEIEKYGYEVLKTYALQYLLITRSDQGMTLIAENECRHFRAEAKEVYDVSGAGDTVVATLAAALASQKNMIESIQLANQAAEIVVGKIGTAPIKLDELKARQTGYEDQGLNKIKTQPQLIEQLQALREKNKKVVFTNGCFDIIHKGHVNYLRKARQLGDLLVVGLNTDQSVHMLKGKNRPVNSENDRALVLASMEFVDYIVLFNDETPFELIKAVKPHILVKGGDYQPEQVVGREFADSLTIIPFVDGYSTSRMIEKMNQKEDREK